MTKDFRLAKSFFHLEHVYHHILKEHKILEQRLMVFTITCIYQAGTEIQMRNIGPLLTML